MSWTGRTQTTGTSWTGRPSLIKVAIPIIYTGFWVDTEIWEDDKYWLDNGGETTGTSWTGRIIPN